MERLIRAVGSICSLVFPLIIASLASAQIPDLAPVLSDEMIATSSGNKSVLFIRMELFSQLPPVEEVATDAKIDGAIEYANDVFERSSDGQFSIASYSIFPQVIQADETATSTWNKANLARDRINELSGEIVCPERTGTAPSVYHICVVVHDGLGGTAGGGSLVVMGFFGSSQNLALTHELAHLLGARHSNFLSRNRGNIEYAGIFDWVMGGADSVSGPDSSDLYLSTYHRINIGWIPFSQVQVVTEPGLYEIFASDQPGVTGSVALAFYVPDPSLMNSGITRDYFYFVDFRQTRPPVVWDHQLKQLDGAVMVQLGYKLHDGRWGNSQVIDSSPYSILGITERHTADDALDAPLKVNRRMWLKGAGFVIQPVAFKADSVVVSVSFAEDMICGDRTYQPGEECDAGLGCSVDCKAVVPYAPQDPWSSSAALSCGDGRRDAGEQCDGGTGCTALCECASGYRVSSFKTDTSCQAALSSCGNGILDLREQCDGGVGCDACVCQDGYAPQSDKDCAVLIVDDGVKSFAEVCDGTEGCLDNVCSPGYDLDPLHPELECQPVGMHIIEPDPLPPPVVDIEEPVVMITDPLNGQAIDPKTTYSIIATATDNVGVDRVEISVNGDPCRVVALADDEYSCTWRSPGSRNKTYSITARAYDASGLSSQDTIRVHTERGNR